MDICRQEVVSLAEVEKVFLIPTNRKTEEKTIGRALGYPTPGGGSCTFLAFDQTEEEEMQALSLHACGVCAFEFFCPDNSDTFLDILKYLGRCCEAAESVGTNLVVNLEQHEKLSDWIDIQKSKVQR